MLVTEHTFVRTMEQLHPRRQHVVDLETTGLDTWHGDKLVSVVVDEHYFPFRHGAGSNLPEAWLTQLLELLCDGQRSLGGHNLIRFDAQMMANEAALTPHVMRLLSGDVHLTDTMIDALLYNENEPTYRLEALTELYVDPAAGHEDRELRRLLKEKGLTKGEMWKLSATEVEAYGCADTRNSAGLQRFYRHTLQQQGQAQLAEEMYQYARLLTRIERTGLLVDVPRMQENMARVKQLPPVLLAELREAADNPTLNPGSPKQLKEWLGLPATDKATLRRANNPNAGTIIRYRQASKANSTYYEPILRLRDEHDVIHPQMNITRDPSDRGGTRSGRLSCSKPNFQNLPTESDIYQVRTCVRARPGHVLLGCDYERAEVWMGGSYCGSPAILDAYHHDIDIYQEMSDDLSITRKEAKILFLMIQYGAGAWKIAETFGWPEEKAWQVRRRFYASYPHIPRAMNEHTRAAEATGHLRLYTGRVRHFDGIVSRFYSAWNARIQGSVGEMVREAMQQLEPVLDHFKAEMLLQVHDEIVIECPEEKAASVIKTTVPIMTAFDHWELRPRVEVKMGPNYGELVRL